MLILWQVTLYEVMKNDHTLSFLNKIHSKVTIYKIRIYAIKIITSLLHHHFEKLSLKIEYLGTYDIEINT